MFESFKKSLKETFQRRLLEARIDSELEKKDDVTKYGRRYFDLADNIGSGPVDFRKLFYFYDTAENTEETFKQGALPLSRGVPTNAKSFPEGLYSGDTAPYETSHHTGSRWRNLSQQYLSASYYADYAPYQYKKLGKSPVESFSAFIDEDDGWSPHGSIFPGLPHWVKPQPFEKDSTGAPARRKVKMIAKGQNLMPSDEPGLLTALEEQAKTKKGPYMSPEEAQEALAKFESDRAKTQ